ncbi:MULTISPECIES: RidA family protein [unclassified Caulobacter]|jgi:enamine deaminase RidA (YjgF/YER057c/UK114 family)|uniref:RidA family protein n=1 Tax=unclassified Caulobacter TaxID=2648921 RepID=UPI00078529DF|nr:MULTISPECIES: RidA family protein [unclassified Caulobacter]AZS21805.1 RidA family protein [Caulobacter sp. FWC26]
MPKIDQRLAQLGIVLPALTPPVANYVPSVRSGNIVHISGQLSLDVGGGIKGVVGEAVDIDQAVAAARLCGINLIAQFKAACEGDLDRLVRVIKLGGFVQAGPGFHDIPKVINGCSDLMVEVFGDVGRHARSAVGVYQLPLGFAVEVDAIIEVA